MERQLTFDPLPKDLDNNLNFSPDGKWLVFDCRETATGIPTNQRLGMVHVDTGEVRLLYKQKPPALGVGAASFLSDREVVAIHALASGLPYDFTVRGGMIVPVDGSPPRWLDSRDVTPPFTPGALRGGTHKHEPDGSGRWVGFTYNDHIIKTTGVSDLRNVGVSLRGRPVRVDDDPAGANFTGESFSVLLTACVDRPHAGSDEYQRAEGDCWVGRNGYADADGKRRRARAFRGTVAVDEDGKTVYYQDVFVVDVPDDITVPGELGPLEGTAGDYPKPPKDAAVRRVTRSAANPDRRLRGISGHLRTPDDGKWIVYVGKARRDAVVEDQLYVVSPITGKSKQLSNVPGGVVGDPRFSPNGHYVAAALPDGSVCAFSVKNKSWGRAVRRAPANSSAASRIVISPDSNLIAYNRQVEGVMQIFTMRVETSR